MSSEKSEEVLTSSQAEVQDVKKEEIREQLQSDVEAFLKNGGKIDSIEPNVLADPPKKPQSNYGGQPI